MSKNVLSKNVMNGKCGAVSMKMRESGVNANNAKMNDMMKISDELPTIFWI